MSESEKHVEACMRVCTCVCVLVEERLGGAEKVRREKESPIGAIVVRERESERKYVWPQSPWWEETPNNLNRKNFQLFFFFYLPHAAELYDVCVCVGVAYIV